MKIVTELNMFFINVVVTCYKITIISKTVP